jgi:hypothetical protein
MNRVRVVTNGMLVTFGMLAIAILAPEAAMAPAIVR